MKLTHLTLCLLFMCIANATSAQSKTSRWSATEYNFQNRLLHNGMGYQHFKTQLDVGLGLHKKLRVVNSLHVDFGLSLNYGRFKSKAEGTLFISSFKKTSLHYFSHHSIDQLSLELPIGFQLKLVELKQNTVYFTAGAIPQFGLYTRHTGTQWEKNTTVTENLFSKDEPYFQTSLLSDLYLRSGFTYSLLNNTLTIGSGVEYSTFGKSIGLYTKIGYSF